MSGMMSVLRGSALCELFFLDYISDFINLHYFLKEKDLDSGIADELLKFADDRDWLKRFMRLDSLDQCTADASAWYHTIVVFKGRLDKLRHTMVDFLSINPLRPWSQRRMGSLVRPRKVRYKVRHKLPGKLEKTILFASMHRPIHSLSCYSAISI